MGLLADPQQALDLLAAADVDDPDRPLDPDHDPAVCVAEEAVYALPSPFRRPTLPGGDRTGAGEVRLVVHVTDHDLLAGDTDGVARTELGPVLLGRLRSWLLTAARVTIRPVLDLGPDTTSTRAVDRHDPPEAMAEAVRLRDETCVFPGCGRRSEAADLDHIQAYVAPAEGGPPGQTRPANLAPLCRRHHRAKTFGAFSYDRLPDGSYQWTLPSGRRVTTDPPSPRPRPGSRLRP